MGSVKSTLKGLSPGYHILVFHDKSFKDKYSKYFEVINSKKISNTYFYITPSRLKGRHIIFCNNEQVQSSNVDYILQDTNISKDQIKSYCLLHDPELYPKKYLSSGGDVIHKCICKHQYGIYDCVDEQQCTFEGLIVLVKV